MGQAILQGNGGSDTKVFDLGRGSTFDVKSIYPKYNELTVDNFYIKSFSGWTGWRGFDSGNNKQMNFHTNNIGKSYDKSTGVFKVTQNFGFHFGGGTSSGWQTINGGTFNVILVVGKVKSGV